MRPLLSRWIVLLVLAIIFVGVLMWTRLKPEQPEDPLRDAVQSLSKALGLEVEGRASPPGGIKVTGVRPDSPAQRLGFRVGDRVVAVGDRSVWHAINLAQGISQALSAGYPISVMVATGDDYHQIILGRGMHGGGGQGRPAPGG